MAAAAVGVVAALAVHDLRQRRHAILRNFPVLGHFRFWLEAIGPELRQYIVTDNDQERPFNRDQRRWIYTSSKGENNLSGFGSDNDLEVAEEYLIIKHVAFPVPPAPKASPVPAAKVLGATHGRAKAFRPASIVNISGMSFGSLSGPAVEALNRGALGAGCLHTTGEGGISDHHRHGAELVWQIGTGYFGCRTEAGAFDLARAVDQVASAPVRAIEIKLSQGAKAGLGGVVPGVKVTPEIAAIRGVPVGQDCTSPPRHRAFGDVDGLIDFVETFADATGLPVGIKSAVGEQRFWDDLADRMATRGAGPDFVTVDGGEGGTGAAPSCSPTTSPCPSGPPSPASTGRSPSGVCTRTWSSSDRASSVCPRRPCWPWASAATWSTWAARRCCPSAASRPSAATPAAARPASPPSRRG